MIYSHDVEVTPADIRQAWQVIMEGGNPLSERQGSSLLVTQNYAQYRRPTVVEWIGATGAVIQHRLDHGYSVDAKDVDVSGGSTEYVMPTMMLDDEEGDLLIDQVISGEDMYRVQWEEVESPKSLKIRACIGMAAGADSRVIGEYMTWLLKVIDAAQRRGVSPDVELWIGTSDGFIRSKQTMRVRIPLVKAGEMIDVDSWRAFLTPGAFRSLGFVALGLGADQTGKRLNPGMGSPTNKRWGVTLEDGVLEIECPMTAYEFPEGEMDLMLEDAGA